jgi:transcriptional antiterminator NusG
VFPGYVFIKMVYTDETWHIVRNIRGVTGFVGSGDKPLPLTPEEVAAWGVEREEVVIPYNVGDTVRIMDGPLESYLGVVEEIDADNSKIRVVVSMFGRETPVTLELRQVGPVTE